MVYDAGGWGHPPHQFICSLIEPSGLSILYVFGAANLEVNTLVNSGSERGVVWRLIAAFGKRFILS